MQGRRGQKVVVFEGTRMVGAGRLEEVVEAAMDCWPVLILDDETAETVEVDLRGKVGEVVERLEGAEAEAGVKRVGRPKLGVVGKEVTLLPRHWEWLQAQPGGASVALRKLVEEARKANGESDRARRARDSVYRFMTVMGGDLPGYEEAVRALYAGRMEQFEGLIEAWPGDVRGQAVMMARRV